MIIDNSSQLVVTVNITEDLFHTSYLSVRNKWCFGQKYTTNTVCSKSAFKVKQQVLMQKDLGHLWQ